MVGMFKPHLEDLPHVIILNSFNMLGSTNGQTIPTWLSLERAIVFITITLPIGVSCL